MTLLRSNVEAIAERYPAFRREIIDRHRCSRELEVVSSNTGRPTARVGGLLLHSLRDPVLEARRLFDQEAAEEPAFCVMFGFGLGYYVEEFLDRTKNSQLIVVEPDVPLFLRALSLRDLRPALTSDRASFLLGTHPEALAGVLGDLHATSVKIVAPRALYRANVEYFDRLRNVINSFLSKQEINSNTLKRFGRLWIRNLSRNLGALAAARGVNELADLHKGIPALVLAAGPSLDLVLPLLPDFARKCLLIAVDTSLRACLRVGVHPDYTVIVDPQYWNARHLDQVDCSRTILVSESSTHPFAFRKRFRSRFLCDSLFPLGRYIERGVRTFGSLGAGGSVSTSAWDFARLLGCSPIYLAGLDLGYPGNATHYRGSLFEEMLLGMSTRLATVDSASCAMLWDAAPFRAPSNSGADVPTDRRLILYKWWFENQMLMHPEAATRTISEEAVRIEGIPLVSVEELRALAEVREMIDASKTSADLSGAGGGHDPLSDVIERTKLLLSELASLRKLSMRGLEETAALAVLIQEGGSVVAKIETLTRIDASIRTSASRDIAGFLLLNTARDIVNTQARTPSATEVLAASTKLYSELAQSIDYQVAELNRGLSALRLAAT